MSLQEPIVIDSDEQVLEKDHNQHALEMVKRVRLSLNIGCGGGRFETCCLGGINIDIAKPRQKPCKPFIQCDAHYLPFKDGAFIEVSMFDVLEHLDSPVIALKEVKRVLAKNGFLILGTPNAMRILNTLFLFRHGFYIPDPGHISTWGRMELENLIRKIGFVWFTVFPYTYGDGHHSFLAKLFLYLPTDDLTERHLVVIAKK